MAEQNLTMSGNFQINPREVDFVTRFNRNWSHFTQILGIIRPIKKEPGTMLTNKVASVELQSGAVGEGETIPDSQARVITKDYVKLAFDKFKKTVTLEAIDKYGYDAAIQKTDDALLSEILSNITLRLYKYLPSGTLTGNAATFQDAVAIAQGMVLNKWRSMHRDATRLVGFCNLLDAYKYLGAATIGQQVANANGLSYLQNFIGINTLILLSDAELKPGKVIVTPADNVVVYYADPSNVAFERAGLQYTTTRGSMNLIGVHTEGRYSEAVSDVYAIAAMEMFAEYQDGIAVVSFGAAPETTSARLSSLSVSSLLVNPEFDPDVTDYAVTTNNTSNVVRATPEVSGATVALKHGDKDITNGDSVTWNAGTNTVTATVTNGESNTKTYTITVTKK